MKAKYQTVLPLAKDVRVCYIITRKDDSNVQVIHSGEVKTADIIEQANNIECIFLRRFD
jgi:galactokinase